MNAPADLARVVATNMYAAQAFTPTAAQEADLQARADAIRALTGRPGPRRILVPVHTPQGAHIGDLTFTR